MTKEERKEKIIDEILNTLCSLAKRELFHWSEKNLKFYNSRLIKKAGE